MKFRTALLCSIFLLFSALSPAFSQEKKVYGTELCNTVYDFLKKNGYSPSTQSLVATGENAFPYNISVRFNTNDEYAENLVFVFAQDDVIENQDAIKFILTKLKTSDYCFNTTVLFAYGEKQKIEKQDMIFGTQVFIEALNSNLEYTAFIFDLDADRNKVEAISSGISSPPWLIKDTFNTCNELGVDFELPKLFLSQISTYRFIHNRQLSIFFENDIPAIIMSFDGETANLNNGENIKAAAVNLLFKFSSRTTRNWERHFSIIKLFGRYRVFQERSLLRIILPSVLAWLIFIALLFFVNTRLKKRAWQTIGKIWYSVPLLYALLFLSFTVSRQVFLYIFPQISNAEGVFAILITQILFSLLASLCFFILILAFNFGFDENSVDYLLVICCFINQSFFILVDISLSPIFLTICLLSLIALTVKNNFLHVLIFILMILPLVPYAHSVISFSNTRELTQFIKTNKFINFMIPLALYPNFIILFRTLTSMRSKKPKGKLSIFSKILIGGAAYFVFTSGILIAQGIYRTKQLNTRQASSPSIALSPEGTNLISISYSDNKIFDDIIRTLNVELERDCILCDVQIVSRAQNPILYTDNEYTTITSKSIRFKIPDYPPSNMTFSYGASSQPCKITVSAVYEDEQKGSYKFISNSISIGED